MPCRHKFSKYLKLHRIDFTPTTLIIGTFNPEWPAANYAQWFYGRTNNNYFWDVLPRIYGHESLLNATHEEWKVFCHKNQIAITDLICSIDDAEENNPEDVALLASYSDAKIATRFSRYTYINIIELLQEHKSISNIYFTRQASGTFWKTQWHPIADYAVHNALSAKPLITPSRYARFQQTKHNRRNPLNQLTLPDYIHYRWQREWHHI